MRMSPDTRGLPVELLQIVAGLCGQKTLKSLMRTSRLFSNIARPLLLRRLHVRSADVLYMTVDDIPLWSLVNMITIGPQVPPHAFPILPNVTTLRWSCLDMGAPSTQSSVLSSFLWQFPVLSDLEVRVHVHSVAVLVRGLSTMSSKLSTLQVGFLGAVEASSDDQSLDLASLRRLVLLDDEPFPIRDLLTTDVLGRTSHLRQLRLPRFMTWVEFVHCMDGVAGYLYVLELPSFQGIDNYELRTRRPMISLTTILFEINEPNDSERWEWAFIQEFLFAFRCTRVADSLDTVHIRIDASHARDVCLWGPDAPALFYGQHAQTQEVRWDSWLRSVKHFPHLKITVFTKYAEGSRSIVALRKYVQASLALIPPPTLDVHVVPRE
ncbi:uncharacterized protein SCHCODRAFT_01171582 [Schizophyllum commune H4-8]|nr:uncharacterized protein SCHCODRAFT_01171582 [Schizophyllum commune H4-8]KAI5892458.1 hypothetical protein SCHCODRAFT_01171582 [Schizophyllum commune H4-8]